MSDSTLFDLLSWYLVFLFSLVLHEASHAWAAWKMGDPTAHSGGQVSLDPTPHIKREPLGMVVLPLVTFFSNGWMIGWASAPYDRQWADRFPKRAAIMALAGPAANLAIVAVTFVVIKAGVAAGFLAFSTSLDFERIVVGTGSDWAYIAARFLSIAFSLNVILFAFNLLPVPPLDGSSIIKLILPSSVLPGYNRLISAPGMALVGLFAAWYVFPYIGGPLLRGCMMALGAYQ